MEKFWSIEKIGIEEKQFVYQHFCEEISFDENENGYKVKLPFKESHDIIPDNFENRKRRFNSLKKKFINNEYLLSEYNQIIKDQLQADVIEKLEKHIEPEIGQVHNPPQRSVIKSDKQTSKYELLMTPVQRLEIVHP